MTFPAPSAEKPSRLDVRIDHLPLPGPILADGLVATDVPAVHPIRPVDVRMHRRESPVDVTGIERGIGAGEKLAALAQSTLRSWSGCSDAIPSAPSATPSMAFA